MGCWLLVIEPVLCGSNSILKVHFLGHPVIYHIAIFLQHEVRLRPKYIFSRETTTDKNTKQMPTPHKPSDILGQLQTLDLRFVTQSFVSSDFGSDIQSLTIHMSSCCSQAHKLKCVSLK